MLIVVVRPTLNYHHYGLRGTIATPQRHGGDQSTTVGIKVHCNFGNGASMADGRKILNTGANNKGLEYQRLSGMLSPITVAWRRQGADTEAGTIETTCGGITGQL